MSWERRLDVVGLRGTIGWTSAGRRGLDVGPISSEPRLDVDTASAGLWLDVGPTSAGGRPDVLVG